MTDGIEINEKITTADESSSAVLSSAGVFVVREFLLDWSSSVSRGQSFCALVYEEGQDLLSRSVEFSSDGAFSACMVVSEHLIATDGDVSVLVCEQDDEVYFDFSSEREDRTPYTPEMTDTVLALFSVVESYGASLSVEEDTSGGLHYLVSFGRVDIGTIGFKTPLTHIFRHRSHQ